MYQKSKYEKSIFEFYKKINLHSDIKIISSIFAKKIQKIIKPKAIAIIKYENNSVEFITVLPENILPKQFIFAGEIFTVLDALAQEHQEYFDDKDLISEHYKKIFPLFENEKFIIFLLYRTENIYITLEIYGINKQNLFLKEALLKTLIKIFQQKYFEIIKFENAFSKNANNMILNSLIEKIRRNFNEKDASRIILEEIAKVFDADRVCFLSVPVDYSHLPILEYEYLKNPYIKSQKIKEFNANDVWLQIRKNNPKPTIFKIEIADEFIKQNNLEGTPIDIFLKKASIKSSYPVFLDEDNQNTFYLILQFTRENRILNSKESAFLEKFAQQAYSHLKQAKLYSKIEHNYQKTKALIELINLLRGELEITKIIQEFLTKTGDFFDADRCTLNLFDCNDNIENEFFEYKKNYYSSLSKNEFTIEMKNFVLENEKNLKIFEMHYSEDFYNDDFKYKNALLSYLKQNNIKSYLTAFIRYNGQFIGLLSLHYFNLKYFSEDEKNFLILLANQFGTAFYQSKLYLETRINNDKEKFINEILANTLQIHTKEEIYEYFAKKFIQVFDALGVVFVEFDTNEEKKYYEYYSFQNLNLSLFKNIRQINYLLDNKKLDCKCDFEKYQNEELKEFLKVNGVSCIGTIPYGENSLILCFFKSEFPFHFNNTLFLNIGEILAEKTNSVLKTIELKKLRDDFIFTLEHELQIPIIAERNAINYLFKKQELFNDILTKEILENLLKTNLQIEELLKIIMGIYRYEADRKTLNKVECNFLEILNDVLLKNSSFQKSKNIEIIKEIKIDNFSVLADKNEIFKALNIILRNIEECVFDNGSIIIEVYLKKDVLDCVFTINSDNKCFLLGNDLEHKIGLKLYLYFAQLILKAHGWNLFFQNDENDCKRIVLEIK